MSEARDEITGRFQPGHSGNPAGRRKGSKNRATLWAEAMRNGDAEAVRQGVMARATSGEAAAQRFVLARVAPRERCITLPDLPAPSGWPARDARAAFHLIRAALAAGEVSPGEALKLFEFFTRGRAVEDAALEEDWQEERQEAASAARRQQEEAASAARPAPPFATSWISRGFATADRPPIAYATDDAGNPLPLPPVVLTASPPHAPR